MGELLCIRFFYVFKTLCHSCKELGENNAGVSSCAKEHASGGNLKHLGKVVRINVIKRGNATLNCHGHVVAGISVRDREDVQLVNLFCLCLQLGSAAAHHLCEKVAADVLYVPLVI